ncbi:hypothetical protein DP939_02385 [Spongiactinospora rosea]|uniref:Uncharacterized protein n=1 Tax=Spongiactinospora rosea TaxID=2248750 RepID=A0A366M7Q8_9ACTN|nr:hypothetical protein [Spongiactinospora rosea]RBQ21579.1 hypothetical protein DP939_02385 [Spongiactinospora rosea]
MDEPGPHYLICLECGHGFPTADALLADRAALVERLNASLPPPPWDPAFEGPIEPDGDPEKITYCPHCTHDF